VDVENKDNRLFEGIPQYGDSLSGWYIAWRWLLSALRLGDPLRIPPLSEISLKISFISHSMRIKELLQRADDSIIYIRPDVGTRFRLLDYHRITDIVTMGIIGTRDSLDKWEHRRQRRLLRHIRRAAAAHWRQLQAHGLDAALFNVVDGGAASTPALGLSSQVVTARTAATTGRLGPPALRGAAPIQPAGAPRATAARVQDSADDAAAPATTAAAAKPLRALVPVTPPRILPPAGDVVGLLGTPDASGVAALAIAPRGAVGIATAPGTLTPPPPGMPTTPTTASSGRSAAAARHGGLLAMLPPLVPTATHGGVSAELGSGGATAAGVALPLVAGLAGISLRSGTGGGGGGASAHGASSRKAPRPPGSVSFVEAPTGAGASANGAVHMTPERREHSAMFTIGE
jgi:hypothetical protein